MITAETRRCAQVLAGVLKFTWLFRDPDPDVDALLVVEALQNMGYHRTCPADLLARAIAEATEEIDELQMQLNETHEMYMEAMDRCPPS